MLLSYSTILYTYKEKPMNNEFIEQVNTLMENNKPKKAYKFCQKELLNYADKKITKKDKIQIAEIYYAMGSILASCKEMEEAVRCLDHAIEHNPKDDSYYYYRAEMKVAISQLDSALEDYSKCVRINPTNTYYGKRGSIKLQTGDIKGAIKDCSKAIELNPTFGGGYLERGRAKLHSENYTGAIDDFSTAIKLYPDYAISYQYRGDAKRQIGDIKGAIKDYKKLQQLEPRNEIIKQTLKELTESKKPQKSKKSKIEEDIKKCKKISITDTTKKIKNLFCKSK